MAATVINACGVVLYMTRRQLLELLGDATGAKLVNLQGVSIVLVDEEVYRQMVPGASQA